MTPVRSILRPGPVVTDTDWPSGDLEAIHVICIGGAGMSAVARLALERGLRVSGSDAQEGQFLPPLRDQGARIRIGFDAAQLPADANVVVVSTAVRADNPEVLAARERGIPIVHRATALAGLLGPHDLIAVAGTHGKTSTSGMAATALRGAGEDPAWAVGAALPDLGRNAGLGSGASAVVEADESDGSFLAFAPQVVIVTNLEPDHLDFHGTAENLTAAFDALVDRILPGGVLVVCADDEGAAALGRRAADRGVTVRSYGALGGSDWRVLAEAGSPHGTRVRLDGPAGEIETTLAVSGHHNVLNVLGALAAAHALRPQAALADLADGVAGFHGASRRFDLAGVIRGVAVYDDYAHHPREVAATLAAARGILEPDGRVIAVFQPHLYSRTRQFAADFAEALAAADDAFVLPVYGAREDPDPTVTARTVTDLAPHGSSVTPLEDRAAVPGIIREIARPGDVVMLLGAGDIVQLTPDVLTALQDDDHR